MHGIRSVQPVILGITAILISLTIGCRPSATVPAPATPPPTVVPQAPVPPVQNLSGLPDVQQAKKIIFRDDFTNPGSGWKVFTNDYGEGKYENGSYFLKCTKLMDPYDHYKVYTTNTALMSLTNFMLDIDITMLSGDRDDYCGLVLKWPDINPLGAAGYEQPSDYYFCVAPAGMLAWSFTKQEVIGSSVDKVAGPFLTANQYTCVRGMNSINNIKIQFNPNIRFMVNDYEFFNNPDKNLDYVNRLIKNKDMTGATLQIITNIRDPYSRPVFQLNKITVSENN